METAGTNSFVSATGSRTGPSIFRLVRLFIPVVPVDGVEPPTPFEALLFYIGAIDLDAAGSGLRPILQCRPVLLRARCTGGGQSDAPLMTKLNDIHKSSPLDAVDNQAALWEAARQNVWLRFGGISAMPSIHLAIATVYALLAFNVRRWLGVVFCGNLILTQVGSVILGWHYAVDGYAGILLALLIWLTVARLVKRAA